MVKSERFINGFGITLIMINMDRRDFLKGAGITAVVLTTPNLATGQPKQTRPYELNNSSIDPSESGLVKIFDSVYIFSSDLEFVLKDGQTAKTQIFPVGTVMKREGWFTFVNSRACS